MTIFFNLVLGTIAGILFLTADKSDPMRIPNLIFSAWCFLTANIYIARNEIVEAIKEKK